MINGLTKHLAAPTERRDQLAKTGRNPTLTNTLKRELFIFTAARPEPAPKFHRPQCSLLMSAQEMKSPVMGLCFVYGLYSTTTEPDSRIDIESLSSATVGLFTLRLAVYPV